VLDQPTAPTYDSPETPSNTGTNAAAKITTSHTYPIDRKQLQSDTVARFVISVVLFGIFGFGFLRSVVTKPESTSFSSIAFVSLILLVATLFVTWPLFRLRRFKTFSITTDENSLTLHDDEKTIVLPWNEITLFKTHMSVDDKGIKTFKGYIVHGKNNQIITIPIELANLDNLRRVIEQRAAPSITEHLIAQYKEEGKLELGPIEITHRGLLFNKQFIPWESIDAIVVDTDNNVQITKRPVRSLLRVGEVSSIPNYFVLGSFVELLRPRSSGAPLMEQPEAEQTVIDHITATSKEVVPKEVLYRRDVNFFYGPTSIAQHDSSVSIIKSTIQDSPLTSGDDNVTGNTPQRSLRRSIVNSKRPRTQRNTKPAPGGDRSVRISGGELSASPVITGDDSTIGDITVTLTSSRNASAADQHALEDLLAQLKTQLEQAHAQDPKNATAVQKLTNALVQEAETDEPNPTVLQVTAEGLKKAAENIAAVTPTVLGITTQIITHILRVVGL
jgi:hypothetical protein